MGVSWKMKASTLINSFNAGEVSPTLDFRADLDKYSHACKTMKNFKPLLEGGATRVPGTYFVNEVKDSTKKTRVVPFVFNTNQAYILEFGEEYIRFYLNEGRLLGVGATLDFDPAKAYTSGAHSCKVGKYVNLNCGGSKRLIVSMPYGQTLSRESSCRIEIVMNTVDTMTVSTVSHPYLHLKIRLALTTKTKNTAALIQNAIRAKGVYRDYDLTNFCVTENAAYAADRDTVSYTGYFEPELEETIYSCINNISASPTNTSYFPPLEATYWEIPATIPILECDTPYMEADLFNLKFRQSADVLYIWHPSYPSMKLNRLTTDEWSLDYLKSSIDEPMTITDISAASIAVVTATRPVPSLPDNVPMTVTDVTNANPCVITVSRPEAVDFPTEGQLAYFTGVGGTTDLNSNFYTVTNPDIDSGTFELYGIDSSAFGVFTTGGQCYISTFVWPVDGDIVYIEDVEGMVELTDGFYNVSDPDEAAGTFKLTDVDSTAYTAFSDTATAQKQKFGTTGNFPSCGEFFEQRLMQAGTNNNPTTCYGSVSADYENYTPKAFEDSAALEFTLVSDKVEQITSMQAESSLFLLSKGGVWTIGATTTTEPLTQTNVRTKKIISIPASDLEPERINEAIVYPSKSRMVLRRITYDYDTDSWPTIDLNRLAKHITLGDTLAGSGIVDLDVQIDPTPTLWAVRADGEIICLLFDSQEDIYAWYRIPTDGEFESVAVIPKENDEDQIWVVVKRTIEDEEYRYIEFFKPEKIFGEIKDAFFVHSGLTWDGGGEVEITNISKTNPCVVTAVHNFTNGMKVRVSEVEGMTEINQSVTSAYTVANVVAGVSFELSGIDSSSWTTYTGGGVAQQVKKTFTTGLEHLIGETVDVLIDGAVHPQIVVDGTTDTLTYYGNKIHIGLPIDALLEPMPLNSPQTNIRGKQQKITKIVVGFYQTYGGQYGYDEDHLFNIPFGVGATPALYDRDVHCEFQERYDDKATIVIKPSGPTPMTVLSIIPDLAVGE
jgi:hypothetical protein